VVAHLGLDRDDVRQDLISETCEVKANPWPEIHDVFCMRIQEPTRHQNE
jgi:hypothetical protein